MEKVNQRSAQQAGEKQATMSSSTTGVTTPSAPRPMENCTNTGVELRKAQDNINISQLPALSPGSLNTSLSTTSIENFPTRPAQKRTSGPKFSKNQSFPKQSLLSAASQPGTTSRTSTRLPRSESRKSKREGNSDNGCFNCGKTGHQAKFCMNYRGTKSQNSTTNITTKQVVGEFHQFQGVIDAKNEEIEVLKERLGAHDDQPEPAVAEAVEVTTPTTPKPKHESAYEETYVAEYDTIATAVQKSLEGVDVRVDADKYSELKERWVHNPILYSLYSIFALIGLLLTMVLSGLTLGELVTSPYSIFVGLSVLSANGFFRPTWNLLKSITGFRVIYESYLLYLYSRLEGRYYSFSLLKHSGDLYRTCGLDMRHEVNALTDIKFKSFPMTVVMDPTPDLSQNPLISFFLYVAQHFRRIRFVDIVGWIFSMKVEAKKVRQISRMDGSLVTPTVNKTSSYVICGQLLSQLLNIKNVRRDDTAKEIEIRMLNSACAMHKINIDHLQSLAHGNIYKNTALVAAYVQRCQNILDNRNFRDFCAAPSAF